MTSAFQSLNTLEETYFIAGTEYTFQFTLYDSLQELLDITSCSCTWKMSWIGQPNISILTKSGSPIDTNSYQIKLDVADTLGLEGKFIQQPIIEDVDGFIYRPAQGLITIITGIE